MNRINGRTVATCSLVIASMVFVTRGVSAAADASPVVDVRAGTAGFDAETSLSEISVQGKSSELDARASVREGLNSLALEGVVVTLPVKSLAIGMGRRDEHMRTLVVTNSGGRGPDVTFASNETIRSPDPATRQATCTVSADLEISGLLRPFDEDADGEPRRRRLSRGPRKALPS